MIIGEYTISEIFDGQKGEQGVSVSKVVTEWTKSTSPTQLPSNPTWSETKPSITSGEYLWYRDRTDLNNGTSTYSNAVCDVVISGVLTDVDSINNKITNKVWESDITSKINQYDGSTVSTIRDRVTQTEQDISGITTRVSDVESETDDLGTRMSSAESSITQNANNINLKVSKDSVISEINQSSESITISADKVNIEGATIFSSGRLSQTSLNNAYDAKGSAATAKTEAINSANSATDTKLQSYSTTSQMNTAIGTAVNNAVDDIEANAIKSTVSCYYRSTTNTTPTITKNTSIGTSNNTDNAWEYVMPVPKRNAYFFTCEKYTYMDDSVAFSTVRPLDSQTYASKWVSSSDNTYVDGGRIYTHSITTSQLATDAIKSNNYSASQNANSPYSATGSFLDLSTGNFYTPNFGIDNTYGKAYLNGEIIADSGQIGSDTTNYWEIGTKTDYNANDSAAIIGHGSSYIQSGGWMISSDRIDTRSYDANRKYTYLNNNNTYWDFGLHVPNLTSTEVYENNFVYIRKHASTIPTLEGQWDYVFRIDKDGGIEATGLKINGTTIQDMITAGVDGGAYLPTSGGTISGNLTVTGTITGLKTLSINGKTYNGTSAVDVGVIGASYGGTGQSSLKASGTAILSALDTNTTTPVDSDYIATGSSTFYRKTMSKVWDYIKGKINADTDLYTDKFVLKTGGEFTGAITVSDSFTADEITTGNLIVNGAGRFTNGLYGNLTGNVTGDVTGTATKAGKVLDIGNGTDTTFAYSKAGLTTTSWIAAWSGYELRAISPANLRSVIGVINTTGAGNYNWVSATNDDKLITSNTMAYWNGAYNSSTHASNIEYVKAGKLGDIVTHNASEFVTTSGNAASATKFSSNRTIALTGDVTGSASSNGESGWSIVTTVANDSHSHTPDTIYIPSDYGKSGSIDLLSATKIGSYMSNKSFAIPPEAIKIEYSTDGGSTWLDYEASDSHKKGLFSETRYNCDTYLGKATTKEANSLNNQLRITISRINLGRYTAINSFYTWMSTNGNTVYCKLERSLNSSPTVFETIFTDFRLNGWSGHNIRYFPATNLGGGNDNQPYAFRLTVWQTAITTNYPSANLYDIRFYGPDTYSASAPYYKVRTNELYTWDNDLNAIFPAGITATTFTGNATSASKLNSTRSFTIGKTAKNVDWSGAVSFSQAEISDDASTTAAGWMSKDDKLKLNGIETGAQVNTITGVKGGSETNYRTGNVNITASNIGLGNLTNDKQVKGLSSGTTSGHFVTWGSNGYTVTDSGITAGNVVKSVASNSDGKLVLTYADNTTSDPIDVEFVATETSSVSKAEALNVNGTAVGSATVPVYFDNKGKPQTANTIPKLNNTTTGGTFYAPTGAGTSGQILKSSGGTPSWVDQSTLSVGSATTAGAFSSNASVTLTGDTTGTASSTKGWTIATTTKKLSSSTTDSLNNFIDSEAFKYTYAAGSNSITDKPASVDAFGAFSFKTAAGWYGQLLISSNQASGIYWRTATNLSGSWKKILDSNNYTDYTVTKTGTGASGTWGIGISGNATTATKFSSNRSVALTGDVTGSASSNGENGWSITTTVGDDSHNHTTQTIIPRITKSYTGVIASANNDANCHMYYFKVVPDSYAGQWSIKYRVYATIDGVSTGNGSGFEESVVYISGMRNTYSAYRTWNNISNTSYRPYYYHTFYRAKEAGISYGHLFGVSLRYAYNPTTTTNTRNVTFEILDYEGCTPTFFDSPIVYANASGTGSTNYEGLTTFDATTQGLTTSGDRNDVNWQNRENYSSRTTKNALYRYQICLTNSTGQLIPINSVNNSVATDKVLTTDAFDPIGEIFYWASTNTYNAGGNVGNSNLYRQQLVDLRYSFNCGGYDTTPTLNARLPLYLVASPQTDGTAKLHSSPLSQTLPVSDDGLIYIYLGMVYEDTKPYRVVLSLNHPIYWYKNGAVRPFVQRAENANIANSATNATNATYTNNLLAYSGNEVTIGANSATAGSSTNNVVYINYKDLNSGSTSNNSTAITDYYFGNRKGGIDGVNVRASKFVGALSGNATSATQDGSGNTITSYYVTLSTTQTISGAKTFSSAVTFANGTWNLMGDDAYIGDCNAAGKIGIKGKNGATGVRLVPYSGSTNQDISTDGTGNLTVSGNLIQQGTVTVGSHAKLTYNSTIEALEFSFI